MIRLIFTVIILQLSYTTAHTKSVAKNGSDTIAQYQIYTFTDTFAQFDQDNIHLQSFPKQHYEVPNLGVTNYTTWVKLLITPRYSTSYVILFETPDYRQIDGYKLVKSQLKSLKSAERDYLPNYTNELIKDKIHTFYFEITPYGKIHIPIKIKTTDQYYRDKNFRHLYLGLLLGTLISLIFYNTFLYISTKSKIYLLYVIYVLNLFLAQSSLLGILQQYFSLFPPYINILCIHVFSGTAGITGILFATSFLKTKTHTPRLHKLSYLIYIGYVTSITASIVKLPHYSHQFSAIFGGLSSIYLLVAAIVITSIGYKPAKFFLIAWSTFLVGLLIYILRDMGFLPYNSFTTYTIPIGSALETVLLSFALADRINTLKKEKEINQLRIYEEMKKSRDLISNQKQYLEKMVEERTQSLADINKNLNATLNHLKATQIQLIEAEKMASLGQLTAGIAHEINNPINFVSSNIHPLKKDIQDILKVLTYYQELARNSNDIHLKEILEKSSSLDLETSIEEITNLIDGIEEGARRTSAIVNSLKTFSRSDKEGANLADMNIGIESTLTILKSQIGPIEVETQFGPIPEIMCYSGKLNQVFMNLIDNSIDSIKDKYTDLSNGIISIRTYCDQENIYIDFYDNGTGIPNDLQNKIFEPFFTTKEVGKGTGLGLSITYGIVESHHGHIKVQSSEGSHTLITISIPMNINQIEQN